MYIAVDDVALLQHLYYLRYSPQGFQSSQNGFSLDTTGRLCVRTLVRSGDNGPS